MKTWILDIETTTDHKTLRLGGFYSSDIVHTTLHFTNHVTLIDCLNFLEKGDVVYTWNGARFDAPKIKELLGVDIEEEFIKRGVKHKDGMLLAKLLLPEEPSYSLDAFAEKYYSRIKKRKMEVPHLSWYDTCSTLELIKYLNNDLEVTDGIVRCLRTEKEAIHKSANWGHPLKIEHKVAEIIQRQVDTGVKFDTEKAISCGSYLSRDAGDLEAELETVLPWVPIPLNKLDYPPKRQFKKDGSYSEALLKYCKKYDAELYVDSVNGENRVLHKGTSYPLPILTPFIHTEQLKPSQTGRIKDYLLEIGWVPTQYNTVKDKTTGRYRETSPMLVDKVTKEPCPNLEKVGVTWASTLSTWLQVRARKSLLSNPDGTTGLIRKALENDDIISSDADTCGTPTSRFKHRGIVNIPRVTSFYGKEIRSLFTARAGMKMVGWDANSLEAAMEAHYVYPYDKDYAEMLISGDSKLGTDIHTKNWKALGLKDRDEAKAFKYATTYGAQPKKLSRLLGVPFGLAEVYFNTFWRTNEGLRDFKEALEKEWKLLDKKYLLGLDGRLITTRSAHSILNSKFQGAGSVVMKHAMVIADGMISKRFSQEQAHGLIRMHDEEQWECEPYLAEEIGRIGTDSVRLAGEYLNLNVPISASYKIGNNWAETH